MESSEILSYIKGVRLTFDNKSDVSRYGYKVKELDKTAPLWLCDIVQTPAEARLLGIALAWNGIYHMEINKDVCTYLVSEWLRRVSKPSLIFDDVEIFSPADIRSLIKENNDWAYILQMTSSKKIHPITYCYIAELTNAPKEWKSTRWKFSRKKFEVLQNVVDIPSGYVIQLSRYLKTTFEENKNERNHVEVSSKESGQPGVQR